MKAITDIRYIVVRSSDRRKSWSEEGMFNSLREAKKQAKQERDNYPSSQVEIWKESIMTETVLTF
jgi:hypothetical protein